MIEDLIPAVNVLAEQRTQQCLEEKLIAIRKEQLEILKKKRKFYFFTAEGIANSVSGFKYSPDEGMTFLAFY